MKTYELLKQNIINYFRYISSLKDKVFILWKSGKRRKILLSLLISLLIANLFIFLQLGVTPSYVSNDNYSKEIEQKSKVEKQIESNIHQGDITSGLEVFINNYKKVIDVFSPIFDNFISSTPDVTGKSNSNDNLAITNLTGFNDVSFKSGTKIDSAMIYSNKLNLLVIPLMTVLIVISVFGELIDFDGKPIKLIGLFSRVISTVILLTITPIILSISIQASNLLTKYFANNTGLLDFINNFLDSLLTTNPTSDNALQELLNRIINSQLSPLSLIQTIPVSLPMIIILLQFVFLSFQFILRFVNLYFLACIYPISVVFNIHAKTANINVNFWKSWLTLIIHQPFFILAYVIIQNMLLKMLRVGPSMEQIIIFVGMLLFLSSVNLIVAKIFGDIFTAITNNVMAAAGTAIVNRYTNLRTRFSNKTQNTTKVSKKKINLKPNLAT